MCKRGLKARLLSLVVASGLLFSGISLGIVPGLFVEPVEVQAAEATDYNLASNIQDGVVLHCFNWKYTDIIAELPNIAAAGFTSVQTSPAQVGFSSGVWWKLYQPLGFYVGTNDLGTKEELARLCSEADKYGIKVIVDVVSNHLAGDHSNIQNDLKDAQYWHTYGTVSSWADRYQVVQGEIGMPDIKSEHSYVQQVVANYINELKNLGVDGIRWDAAKHIALPSEGCNFWPTVTIQGLYHYGEILVGPDDRQTGNEGLMKEYTNYMTVTDSTYGKTLRDAFASGTVPTGYGNWSAKGIANNKLIYWAESHDTWSNNQDWGYSNGMSQNVIDRAYAVAASRDGVSALYFSRPFSTNKDSIYAGQKGSTHFTSPEVSAINHFHNTMIGQVDYYTTGSNCAVVCREQGAVVVAGSGSNFSVTVPNGGSTTEAGTYVDAITGEKWTVNNSTMSGKIGSTGIAVLYKEGFVPDPVDPVEPDDPVETEANIFYKNTNNWSSVNAYYWSDSNTMMTVWPGEAMTNLGDGVYGIKVPEDATYIIFNNGGDMQTVDLPLNGFYKIYNNGSWSSYGTTVEPEEPDVTPLVITSQPVDATVVQDSTAAFTVVATGNVVSYQWQCKTPTGSWKNVASSVEGYNQATLYMGAIEARNGYQYRCVVKGENGNVVTDAATLTVVSGITITSQPQNVYISVNGTAVFSVEVTGNVASYKWQCKKPDGSWKNVSSSVAGYNEAIMSIPAIKARDGYQFRCVVKDEKGKNTITEVAALTINPDAALTITSQPTSVTVAAGTKASFSVAAKGEGLFYLWQYRTSANAEWNYCAPTTEGYNTATIKVDAAAASNGYQYRCVIANSDGAVLTTNAAKLTVR